MTEFKFFHGFIDDEAPWQLPPNNRRDAFERLMTMLHDVDIMAEPNRNNYEILDDINDWNVTLSDGLGEE
jgi:hypothetical protein